MPLSFSALQRAENSSMHGSSDPTTSLFSFQCSSASRKFLNLRAGRSPGARCIMFQCSSASRKFLNYPDALATYVYGVKFQCSSASRKFLNLTRFSFALERPGQFQCSSASRKFLNPPAAMIRRGTRCVSVLFSEPKIPQSRPSHLRPSIFPTAMITLRHS